MDTSVSFVRWQKVNRPQAWVDVVFYSPLGSQFDVFFLSAFNCYSEKVNEDIPVRPFSPLIFLPRWQCVKIMTGFL